MKNNIILATITAIIVSLIFVFIIISEEEKFGEISGNSALGTNSTLTATTTAKLWLAGASNAQFRSFSNVGVYDAWLSATTTNLVADYGLWLKASSTLILSGDSLYTGAIYGIGTGTTTISILQI